MKASEFRVNNLVNYRLKDELDERKEWDEPMLIDAVDIGVLSDGNSENYSPIRLTEYWLRKFGFERVAPRSGIASSFIKNGIRIDISNSGNAYYKRITVPYVHTLQNLFFALKQEELTINNQNI